MKERMKWWKRIEKYQTAVGGKANEAMVAKGIRDRTMPITVEVEAYNTRLDVDNVQKVILDGLEGITCLNDSQVYSITSTKIKDKNGQRATITVRWG
jgi:Holliday junction resolvase RusA-like endonuclease